MALKADQPIRWWKRIGTIGVGYSVKKLESNFFDEVIYGTVIGYLTIKLGGVLGSVATFFVMAPLSALTCFWYIRIYDRTGKDWFGFEAAKRLHDELESGGYGNASFTA